MFLSFSWGNVVSRFFFQFYEFIVEEISFTTKILPTKEQSNILNLLIKNQDHVFVDFKGIVVDTDRIFLPGVGSLKIEQEIPKGIRRDIRLKKQNNNIFLADLLIEANPVFHLGIEPKSSKKIGNDYKK